MRIFPLLFVLMVLLVSCDDNSSNVGSESTMAEPEIDLSDPQSIERWESGDLNVLASKIKVSSVRYFREEMRPVGEAQGVDVPIQICGALSDGVRTEQIEALEQLLKNEEAIYQKAREGIYKFYQESYEAYKKGWSLGAAVFGGGDFSDVLPEVVAGNELDELVRFEWIFVHSPRNGRSKIGIECSCSWDEEHGLGVLISGDEIEDVGLAEVSYPNP